MIQRSIQLQLQELKPSNARSTVPLPNDDRGTVDLAGLGSKSILPDSSWSLDPPLSADNSLRRAFTIHHEFFASSPNLRLERE